MITWKEKVSMLGMKAAMAVVVGLAIVVKPAMNAVFDCQERWKAGNDKEFFARLRSVFDHSDETMPGTKKIDMDGIEMGEKKASKGKFCRGCVGDKKHPTCPAHGDIKIEDVANAKAAIDRGLELIDKLSQTTGEPNLQGIKKSLQALIGNLDECVCCDCLEDCFCMDCPVHPNQRADKKEFVELFGKEPVGAVCCGCLGTNYCDTCPVHAKAEYCSDIIDSLRGTIKSLDDGVDMGLAGKKALDNSQWKKSYDAAFDRLYQNTKKSSAEEIEANMLAGVEKLDADNKRARTKAFAELMAKKGLCRDDFFSMQIQVAEINKWNDDTVYAMKKYVNALPNKPYTDPKVELEKLQVSMNDLVADMGGETKDISMKDIKKAAKQANKKKPAKNRKSTMKKPDSKTPRGKK